MNRESRIVKFALTAFFAGVLPCLAQQPLPQQSRLGAKTSGKVMNIQKTDGTNIPTRVADLKQISFLAMEEDNRGLLVKTLDGEAVGVLFEAKPIVTVSDGKLIVKSTSADALEFEISDISEIMFCEASDITAINELEGFACVLQNGSVLLRNIPSGIKPRVYAIDGRCVPIPSLGDGNLRLSRATLGTGIFIVKVGTFTTKIQL